MKKIIIPRLLLIWTKFESYIFGESLLSQEIHIDHPDNIKVLFDGHPSGNALISGLLRHRIPQITILKQDAITKEWGTIAESIPAIPDPYIFGRALKVCLHRLDTLIQRSKSQTIHERYNYDFTLAEYSRISTFQIVSFAICAIYKKIIGILKKRLSPQDHWQMAYYMDDNKDDWELFFPEQDILKADPFIWTDNEGISHIFFEYMPYKTNKGVINHVSYNPETNKFKDSGTVLECPYHLSFPYIFEYNGDIFMIPETGQNRTIEIYKASKFPQKWILYHTAMTNIIANDTVLYRDGETWWLFTSVGIEGEKNWDELSIFYSDSPFGEWIPHSQNPVKSDCRSARMAGNIYKNKEGKLIRPAQDCTHGYGTAISLCEIEILSKTDYKERVCKKINPPKNYSGAHTLNKSGRLTFFDLK